MSIPVAKISLIIANTIAAYISLRPPRPPPNANERAKYKEREETKDIISPTTWFTVPGIPITSAIIGLCEIYVILSTVYPTLQNSLLQRILLPPTARKLTAADFDVTLPFVLGSFVLYAGSFLRYLCYRTLGRHFTFELSVLKEHKLVTEGPYSLVRHPSYLGMTVALPGLIVAQLFSSGTWWVETGMWETVKGQVVGLYWIGLVVFVVWGLLARVAKEDLIMKTEFKDEWKNWQRRTPYAVIPYVW